MAERASIAATEHLLDDELYDDARQFEQSTDCLLITLASKQDIGKLPVCMVIDSDVAQVINDVNEKPSLPRDEQLLFMLAASADGAWLRRSV